MGDGGASDSHHQELMRRHRERKELGVPLTADERPATSPRSVAADGTEILTVPMLGQLVISRRGVKLTP